VPLLEDFTRRLLFQHLSSGTISITAAPAASFDAVTSGGPHLSASFLGGFATTCIVAAWHQKFSGTRVGASSLLFAAGQHRLSTTACWCCNKAISVIADLSVCIVYFHISSNQILWEISSNKQVIRQQDLHKSCWSLGRPECIKLCDRI
jgi:hypothetical protein